MNRAVLPLVSVALAVVVGVILALTSIPAGVPMSATNDSTSLNVAPPTEISSDSNNITDVLAPNAFVNRSRGHWLIRTREPLVRECSISSLPGDMLCSCASHMAASSYELGSGCEWSGPPTGNALQSISRDSFTKKESITTGHVAVWNSLEGDPIAFVHPWSCVHQHLSRLPQLPPRTIPQVMFLGHSHARVMTAMLCMMLNMSRCHLFKKQLRTVDVNSVAEDVTTVGGSLGENVWRSDVKWLAVSFVRTLYDLKDRMFAVRRAMEGVVDLTHSPPWTNFAVNVSTPREDEKNSRSAALLFPSVVIYSRGAWDLAYLDTPLPKFYQEFTASLLELNVMLPPETQVVVYPHHATQRIKGKDKWQKNLRNLCLGDRRALELRKATFCAIRAAIDLSNARVKSGVAGTALIDRIGVFDVWSETRAPMSLSYTDYGGHHYKDIILEALTMKLLRNHICPTDTLHNRTRGDERGVHVKNTKKARIERLLARHVSREYCDKHFAGTASVVGAIESCSCHNVSAANNSICVIVARGGKKK